MKFVIYSIQSQFIDENIMTINKQYASTGQKISQQWK